MPPLLRSLALVALGGSALCVIAQFSNGNPIALPVQAFELRSADLDADGDLDLVALVEDHHVRWSENLDGTGTFSAWNSFADLGDDAVIFTFSDLDMDGLVDLVYVPDDESEVRWRRNLGNGQCAQDALVGAFPGTVGSLVCRDLNGNGDPDVVLALSTLTGSGFGWFANDEGSFGILQLQADLIDGPASPWLFVADLDLVGGNDVVLQDANGTIVALRNLEGNATSWDLDTLVAFATHPYSTPQFIDVDLDADLDIAEASAGVVHWARNPLGEGGLWAPFVEQVLSTADDAGKGLFGSIGCSTGGSVVYVPDEPTAPVRWSTYLGALHEMAYLADLPGLPRGNILLMADLDGDGREDLLLDHPAGGRWYRAQGSATTVPLTLPVLDTLCVFGPPMDLPAVLPEGRWTGPGVIADQLHRALIGFTGDHLLGFTHYEEDGCPAADTTRIRLLLGPVIDPPLTAPICSGNGPVQLLSIPENTVWSGVSPDGVLDPATYGGQPIACVWTDPTGIACATVSGPVLVWTSVPVEIAPAGPFCVNSGLQAIQPALVPPQGGTWSGDITGSVNGLGLFDPALGAGSYQIILSVAPNGPSQCPNSDTLVVTVSDQIPSVSVEPMPGYCANGMAIPLSSATPSGGSWTGPGVDNGEMLTGVAGVGSHLVTYSYQAPEGCSNSASTVVHVLNEAVIAWTADDLEFCPQDAAAQFTALPPGGTWLQPVTADGLFDPSANQPGTYPLGYVYTDPNGCTLSAPELEIHVLPATEVSIQPLPMLCADWAPVALTANMEGQWSGAVNGTGVVIPFAPAQIGIGTWMVQFTATLPDACPGVATMEIVVDACTGITTHGGAAPVVVPNPFQDLVSVDMGTTEAMAVEVLDATGRFIHSAGPQVAGSRFTLNLAHTLPGTYVLRMRGPDGLGRSIRLLKL